MTGRLTRTNSGHRFALAAAVALCVLLLLSAERAEGGHAGRRNKVSPGGAAAVDGSLDDLVMVPGVQIAKRSMAMTVYRSDATSGHARAGDLLDKVQALPLEEVRLLMRCMWMCDQQRYAAECKREGFAAHPLLADGPAPGGRKGLGRANRTCYALMHSMDMANAGGDTPMPSQAVFLRSLGVPAAGVDALLAQHAEAVAGADAARRRAPSIPRYESLCDSLLVCEDERFEAALASNTDVIPPDAATPAREERLRMRLEVDYRVPRMLTDDLGLAGLEAAVGMFRAATEGGAGWNPDEWKDKLTASGWTQDESRSGVTGLRAEGMVRLASHEVFRTSTAGAGGGGAPAGPGREEAGQDDASLGGAATMADGAGAVVAFGEGAERERAYLMRRLMDAVPLGFVGADRADVEAVLAWEDYTSGKDRSAYSTLPADVKAQVDAMAARVEPRLRGVWAAGAGPDGAVLLEAFAALRGYTKYLYIYTNSMLRSGGLGWRRYHFHPLETKLDPAYRAIVAVVRLVATALNALPMGAADLGGLRFRDTTLSDSQAASIRRTGIVDEGAFTSTTKSTKRGDFAENTSKMERFSFQIAPPLASCHRTRGRFVQFLAVVDDEEEVLYNLGTRFITYGEEGRLSDNYYTPNVTPKQAAGTAVLKMIEVCPVGW